MKFLFISVISLFALQILSAQNSDITIVYTNNTNGNLENCV
jgi:hypothetical protein